MNIQVIRDSREKLDQGWIFKDEEKKNGKLFIEDTIVQCLDAADYTIKGYEDKIRIERKQNFCELFNNLINKENRLRFERELEKLRVIPHKYIIVEDILSEGMMGLSIPQYKYGAPVSKIVEMLLQYQIDYGVIPIFAGSAGKKVARKIFDIIIRKYK